MMGDQLINFLIFNSPAAAEGDSRQTDERCVGADRQPKRKLNLILTVTSSNHARGRACSSYASFFRTFLKVIFS